MAEKVERKFPVKGDAWRTPPLALAARSSSRPVSSKFKRYATGSECRSHGELTLAE